MTARCKLCGEERESDEALQEHYREAHQKDVRWCSVCGRGFQFDSALEQHYRDKHPAVSPTSSTSQASSPPVTQAARSGTQSPNRGAKGPGKGGRRSYRRRGRKKRLLAVALAIVVVGVILGAYYVTATSQSTLGTGIYGTKVGDYAPDFALTLANGTTTYLSSFQPHPVLLWFVATWCSSCIQGASVLNSQYYQTLHSKGLQLVTVELYQDLNESGPSISQFAQQYGGGLGKPGWVYGTSDWETTQLYDPAANLEEVYLVNQYGVITMVNLPLVSLLPQIASQSYSSAPKPAFPFGCLGTEGTTIHIHPWLRIVIDGQNVTIPAAIGIENPSFETYNGYNVAASGSCFEPIHTHDSSGIIHIESPTNSVYTLGDFFLVWQATYGYVTINGVQHPIVFNPTDILGFKTDSTHRIVLLVDGKPSTAFDSLVLNQLDYCSAASTGPPCYPTASGNPYYNGQPYPYGTGHTIVIEYVPLSG
jgi:thiol-disulfide isomerase/thioredoxin